MRDRVAELAGRAREPVGELTLIVASVGFAAVVLIAGGRASDPGSWGVVALMGALAGCAALARAHPLVAVVLACPLVAGLGLLDVDATTDLAIDGAFVATFVLCFRVGSRVWAPRVLPVLTTLSAVLLVAASSDLAIWDVDPSPFMVTVGAWAGGLVVAARMRAQSELDARGRELAVESERYTAEAMRYERDRIARELHDIVAHCLSAVVVQAGAGDYVVAGDPTLTATVFDEILGSVRQAEDEIGRLVAVLADAPGTSPGNADSADSGGQPAERVATLVRRAQAAGLSIGYRLTGDPSQLSAELWDRVYRVLREAVTNALKHAPGSPIAIEVRCRCAVEVEVRNGPPRTTATKLASTGGGYGLRGMRERVEADGGRLDAGPAAGGGWLVTAAWPAAALTAPHADGQQVASHCSWAVQTCAQMADRSAPVTNRSRRGPGPAAVPHSRQ